MKAVFAPVPDAAIPQTRSLVVAGMVSLALHGGVWAAASWLWVPTIAPPEAPPLVAVALVPEAMVRSNQQSLRLAPAGRGPGPLAAAMERALALGGETGLSARCAAAVADATPQSALAGLYRRYANWLEEDR